MTRYGLSFLPDARPEDMPADRYFANALKLAEMADRAGMGAVKMTEHYLHPYGGYCPSPLTFLAAVAAQTSQIRLMTGGILPAFHHPVQLAAHCAMVDALSGGRLDVGLARAYLPYEFAAFGVPLDESRDRFVATARAMQRLWTEDAVSAETPFFTLDRARSLPKPVQRPHPPLWGAAVSSRQSFAWLGENGFGLLVTSSFGGYDKLRENIAIYRESFAEAPANAGRRSAVTLSLPLYVAPTPREAEAEADQHLAHYMRIWSDATAAWDTANSRDYPGYTKMARALRSVTPADLRASKAVVTGDPAGAAAVLAELLDIVDIDTIIWQIDFGAMPFDRAARSLTLFNEEVAGRLAPTGRTETPPAAADAAEGVASPPVP
ncbi:LLM class flavin-dependent oxidoreductase [Psychromarinibacter sp. C21-152]|uniref:LLM class flavin-dependent oxidoreductase n=1 Tax=Psychromarinibacter sediminicola TaxID=3033385 RepID=A0AAE3NQV5_9RHOB|nr:LLM class flavin-dependent oxidoreductase [Psychromarinibacter sediminicola]MDF0602568.1 LLM class flavin-dependent oxidoreductase [Psychromarinibacter sediminicola]